VDSAEVILERPKKTLQSVVVVGEAFYIIARKETSLEPPGYGNHLVMPMLEELPEILAPRKLGAPADHNILDRTAASKTTR